MISDVWTARESFKQFKVIMKGFSKELEVSGWEGFRPNEAFTGEVNSRKIEIDFGPTVFCGFNKLPTTVSLADIVKSQ